MESAQSSPARVVLLGASNLTQGLAEACSATSAALATPVDFFVAAGRGRSYGQLSRLLGRVLPSIEECGVWSALARSPIRPTYALVTDLGNDLVFGASAERVQQWLERALDRLAALDAKVVVTGLPLASIERLPAWKFRLAASVLFPWHDADRARLVAQARELDERIAAVCRGRGLSSATPRAEWYGHDPIHVRAASREEAWSTYVCQWGTRPGTGTRARLVRTRGRFWYERVRLLGVECGAAQPCTSFADGSSLRLY